MSSIEDVQSMIDSGMRESEVVEYKRATNRFTDAENHEIAKDISAMANSLGGIIIYGVATSGTDRTLPERIIPINIVNIETLDRVINSQIRPPIQGLRKKLIPTSEAKVVIVEIPVSDDPPHQSLYDKRYYRRSGSESLAMEHDLIALKFGRKLSPVLQIDVKPLSGPLDFSTDESWSKEIGLRFMITNTGRRIGRYVQVFIKLPERDAVRITSSGSTLHIDKLYEGIQVRQFIDDLGVYHPGMSTSVIELLLQISKPYARDRSNEPFVDFTLFADEISPKVEALSLNQLGWSIPKIDG